MDTAISSRREDISALCRRYGVKRLDLFGRPVDLVTDRSLTNPYLRHNILQSRQPVYAA